MHGEKGGMTSPLSEFFFTKGSFRFCVNCTADFPGQGRDANRISPLSMEGRSSATTVMMIESLQAFQRQIPEEADDESALNCKRLQKSWDSRTTVRTPLCNPDSLMTLLKQPYCGQDYSEP